MPPARRRGEPTRSHAQAREGGGTRRNEGYMIKKKSKHGAIALQTQYILEQYIEYIKELFGDVVEQNITYDEKVDRGRKYDE
jgi:hypothetical protein